jgi:hypothetical protein
MCQCSCTIFAAMARGGCSRIHNPLSGTRTSVELARRLRYTDACTDAARTLFSTPSALFRNMSTAAHDPQAVPLSAAPRLRVRLLSSRSANCLIPCAARALPHDASRPVGSALRGVPPVSWHSLRGIPCLLFWPFLHSYLLLISNFPFLSSAQQCVFWKYGPSWTNSLPTISPPIQPPVCKSEIVAVVDQLRTCLNRFPISPSHPEIGETWF